MVIVNRRVFLALCIFLTVLSAKLSIIYNFGGVTPFWDQWDAEAAKLYKPYLEGQLNWLALLDSHNEHRILVPRLLGIGLMELGGEWDPILEMVANAALHSGFVALLSVLIGESLTESEFIGFSIFSALLFSLPLGWENTLAGFQSCFYFVLLFSLVAIWATVSAAPFSRRWWLGIVMAIAAYFSLASGAFALLATISVVSTQLTLNIRPRNKSEWLGVASMVSLAFLVLTSTTTVAGHASLKAQSIGEFFEALFEAAGTPIGVVGILLHMPALFFVLSVLRNPSSATKNQWLLVALAAWVFMQMIALAYGRALGADASRYRDLLIVLLPIDYVALLWLLRRRREGRTATVVISVVWLAVVSIGLASAVANTSLPQVREKGRQSLAQFQNVQAYLLSGDKTVLHNKPLLDVPYPRPDRLAALLSDPTIRMILPTDLRPPDVSVADLHERLALKGVLSGPVLYLKRASLIYGYLLLALAAALWVTAIATHQRSGATSTTGGPTGRGSARES